MAWSRCDRIKRSILYVYSEGASRFIPIDYIYSDRTYVARCYQIPIPYQLQI